MNLIDVAQSIAGGKWDELQKTKRIDFASGKFEANGKTYYLETKLTVARYCEFQILQRELATGMTIQEIYDGLFVQRKLLDQMRFVDSAVHVDKLIMHCAKLKEKEPTVMKLCTLFINTESEDRASWDNDMVVRKMEDWKAECIDVEDFFGVALTLVPGFIEIYNRLTQNISSQLGVTEEVLVSAIKIK